VKIAQFCPYDIDRPGGVQRHILDLSASLIKLGHEVTILAPRIDRNDLRPSNPGSAWSPIVRVGKGRLVSLNKTVFEISFATGSELLKLRRFMSDGGFDVVHFHTPLTPFLSLQGLIRSTAANVATFHAVPPETASGWVQRGLNSVLSRGLASWLDEMILASSVQADIGLKGCVLPPCVNLSVFSGQHLSRFRARDHVDILFLGRLEARKGVVVLLRAFSVLQRKGLPVRLRIAGDGPERTVLERHVSREQLRDVVFLGEVVRDEVPQLYADCDIFCAPSPYAEGFGIILTEAMASGKPVVASANAGYWTVLNEHGNHCLARQGDPADLANKLETLVLRPDLRWSLGEWGRKEAMRYDSDCLATRFLSVYQDAIRTRLLKSPGQPFASAG
jgi:phosphatidyl-myo-inositol alpha-mannosyltransferase